jgi:hypothetical protein
MPRPPQTITVERELLERMDALITQLEIRLGVPPPSPWPKLTVVRNDETAGDDG